MQVGGNLAHISKPSNEDSALESKNAETSRRFLIISAHDYRTARRASLHFIADELAKRGPTRFFSLRYSHLSRLKGDIRESLDDRVNRIEVHNGVECFLWKTLIHPFNTRRPSLQVFERMLFDWYRRRPSHVLVDWIKKSDVIIFESGLAPIYFDLSCQLNPAAKKIYRASDDLETINVSSDVHQVVMAAVPKMDVAALLSPRLADGLPNETKFYYVPAGIDPSIDTLANPSPFGDGLHAVSVGSMLFDPSFFEIAGPAFPDITFHVIGSGQGARSGYSANVKVYGHMKFAETLRYIKHATFGIAPYAAKRVPSYLADSSMKLMQYDFFGLPSVCPHPVVGSYASRFGYTPGDGPSILSAIRAAAQAPHVRSRKCLTYSEVADRLIDPELFEDTHL